MIKKMYIFAIIYFFTGLSFINSQVDPDTAMKAVIDRFSTNAGILFVRDTVNNFPGPNEPVNFDEVPFITHGLGKNGEHVSYYNFDVQPTDPAPIYAFFREGESETVEGQLNVVDVIPGDMGYNDFGRVNKVTVPQNYIANSVTSFNEIVTAGFFIEQTDAIVNCPIVPNGSTAALRYGNEDPGLTRGWYKGTLVYYFNFFEKELMAVSDMVPVSPIYVTFNINPDQPGGGPASGFKTDSTGRAHNVPATLPEDDNYSPLWSVNIFDNVDFDMVSDLQSAQMADILAAGAAIVNCPIVSVEQVTSVENFNSFLPGFYNLYQNFPNPFNPATNIRFSVAKNEHVSIKIFNNIGEKISELVNEILPAGYYSIELNAESFSSGIYYYTIISGNFRSTKKMIFLK